VAFGREGPRSAADLRRDVATLATRLAPAAGARLALHCHDAYAFAVGLLAAGQVGAVAVLPPSRQPGALLRLAGEVAGFVLDGADAPARLEGRPCWSPLAGPGPEAPLVALDREAVWVELFTSGTTGEEKPVPKAVRHLEDEVAVLGAHFGAALGGSARMLSTASPQHLYGLLFRVLWPLAAGRPFLRTPLLHPEELAPYMDEGDFALASTPVALRRLADHAELASRAARCRAVFSSGGPLEAEVARRVADALGAPPFEVYGSTETGGVAVRQQWTGDEAWQPMPGVSAEVDPDDARLVVTSPFVSCGEPVGAGRTRLPTGDRAEAAADGGFRLRGRVDRVVKIAEKRLSLPDMESRLREHPAVQEAALVLLDDGPGEPRVAAVVVPSAAGRARYEAGGRRAIGRELSEHLGSDFDRVLLPRAWRVVDALPRDAQGKTPVRALRALLADAPTRPEVLSARHEPGAVVIEWRVPPDLAQLEGHFPSQPVVAGVVQVQWVMSVLEEELGGAPQLESLEALKFHQVLLPGARARLRLELDTEGARFRFTLVEADEEGRIFSSGRGTLRRA
jgi:acyl-CoA synthetase (AMP-forming)/AMP-acid ligase II/3-hydroxymyristoyl/3-hydroxydecanoyl-(acyl carrier protein) dehydratase